MKKVSLIALLIATTSGYALAQQGGFSETAQSPMKQDRSVMNQDRSAMNQNRSAMNQERGAQMKGKGMSDCRHRQGGFQGPGSEARSRNAMMTPMTVEQVKQLADDARVILTGRITKQITKDRYEFQDKTGTIHLEIDHDKWRGLSVTPEDTVTLRGKVDKDISGTEVEVKRIMKNR